MSRRLKITLPDPACQQLTLLARKTGESLAGVTARLVLSKIEDTGDAGRGRPLVRLPDRERCLPFDGSARTAIERLRDRYPQALRELPQRWWEDDSQLESLRTLAAWRSAIDEHGGDPREELAFHSSLCKCSQSLSAHVNDDADRSRSPIDIGGQ
jgi:hypothetical protein